MNDHEEGLKYQTDIIQKGMLLYIFQIQLNLLLHNHLNVVLLGIFCFLHQLILIAELDAGWVCDARADVQYMHLLGRPVVHIVTNFWSWTYQAHIPKEHINQLRQFIELELTNKEPTLSHARIMTTDSHQTTFISPHPHGAELKNAEVLVLKAHAYLAIEHRPLAIQFNPDS